MSKTQNQSNSLDNIKFVRDIKPETAASYSGGAAFINASSSPDVTVYKDTNSQGDSLSLNASSYDGFRFIGGNNGQDYSSGTNGFNDEITTISITRGDWTFYEDANFTNPIDGLTNIGPGTYDLAGLASNDQISSIQRVNPPG